MTRILRAMSAVVFSKLLALFLVVGLGYVAGRMRWLGPADGALDPARVLSQAAFYVFIPALLFRTTARVDLAGLPWRLIAAYFVPLVMLMLGVYGWQRRWNRRDRLPAAAPAVRAISVTFGNTLQVGIPMSAALFGEAGLAIHITVVSLHALILLSIATTLAEIDLARAHARRTGSSASLRTTLLATARNTVIHPVVLPVVAGLLWNAGGLGLAPVVDEVLQTLGSAVVPLCLTLIGLSLAYYGVRGGIKSGIVISVLKLLALPAIVLVVAHWGFGLDGMPLAVIVMMGALPTGSNALIFSQRYGTQQAETTAAIVFSTLAFGLNAPLWLGVLRLVGAP